MKLIKLLSENRIGAVIGAMPMLALFAMAVFNLHISDSLSNFLSPFAGIYAFMIMPFVDYNTPQIPSLLLVLVNTLFWVVVGAYVQSKVK